MAARCTATSCWHPAPSPFFNGGYTLGAPRCVLNGLAKVGRGGYPSGNPRTTFGLPSSLPSGCDGKLVCSCYARHPWCCLQPVRSARFRRAPHPPSPLRPIVGSRTAAGKMQCQRVTRIRFLFRFFKPVRGSEITPNLVRAPRSPCDHALRVTRTPFGLARYARVALLSKLRRLFGFEQVDPNQAAAAFGRGRLPPERGVESDLRRSRRTTRSRVARGVWRSNQTVDPSHPSAWDSRVAKT